ncbi:hypothetical protein [Devosia sp.]|jgi:hypothetical protein|uniref:hypothetical protein n=1 Tax=Devosia sp. TaxID=1871048 RepID=UPI0037BF46E7
MRNLIKISFLLVALMSGAASTEASARNMHDDGLDRRIDIVNLSDMPIYSVVITDVDNPDFVGPDLLGEDVIDRYHGVQVEPIEPNGYCKFDALVTFEDGTEVTVWDVNLCEATKIAVDYSGVSLVA